MFIDASAIVAILARERGRDEILAKVENAERLATSPVALFEAVLALSRLLGSPAQALASVDHFVALCDLAVIPVDHACLAGLTEAHSRYGKGSGHPARLNMGDCFSYAMAKRAGMALLYKGDDFARTDLA